MTNDPDCGLWNTVRFISILEVKVSHDFGKWSKLPSFFSKTNSKTKLKEVEQHGFYAHTDSKLIRKSHVKMNFTVCQKSIFGPKNQVYESILKIVNLKSRVI